jgi:asparagine synthase (glutamine-hydrolysing)
MCGIVGFSGDGDPIALQAGLNCLSHRGPDNQGLFIDEESGVGLGHCRLSILDVSSLGHQPMQTSDAAVTLIYNGEIYNFRELRAELQGAGYSFRGSSDTEVLLNLYLAEGELLLQRLNGIFAFAIWDGRDQSLLLARDALGVKPLYYAATTGRFVFASEIKALLPLAPETREIDHAALHRYLSFLWCPGEGTPLKSVRKVLPGEAMRVRDGQIARHWSWYELPSFSGRPEWVDKDGATKGVAAHLRAAVHRQMVADVPLGAFLSGGLDSSAVVAFAREHNPDIQCFTIEADGGRDEGESDDLPYARRVAKHLSVPLHVVRIDSARMAVDLEHMVGQLDEPLADPSPLNVLYISQRAREAGIKVLLSGAGGDDLLSGYRRHRALLMERYWDWLPKTVRRSLARGSAHMDQRRPLRRQVAKLFSGGALSGDERIVNYFRWSREASLLSIYSDDFRSALGAETAATPMLDFLEPLPAHVSRLERMLTLEQRFFLADHNLLYTDKMSMAASVEVRVPFLDLDLVDFAARIPAHVKHRRMVAKWPLKKAMEPYLPRDVIYRPKTGFGAPLRRWMRHELRELTGDLLSTDSLLRRGLFDPSAVNKLIAENDAGRVDASYTLFSLLCIEVWCRSFLDVSRAGCVPENCTRPAVDLGLQSNIHN